MTTVQVWKHFNPTHVLCIYSASFLHQIFSSLGGKPQINFIKDAYFYIYNLFITIQLLVWSVWLFEYPALTLFPAFQMAKVAVTSRGEDQGLQAVWVEMSLKNIILYRTMNCWESSMSWCMRNIPKGRGKIKVLIIHDHSLDYWGFKGPLCHDLVLQVIRGHHHAFYSMYYEGMLTNWDWPVRIH
jgi:hypothetical protein